MRKDESNAGYWHKHTRKRLGIRRIVNKGARRNVKAELRGAEIMPDRIHVLDYVKSCRVTRDNGQGEQMDYKAGDFYDDDTIADLVHLTMQYIWHNGRIVWDDVGDTP